MNENKISTFDAYSNVIRRVWRLVISPSEEWNAIKEERKSFNNILSDYALPIIGLITIAAFIGCALKFQDFNLENILKHTTVVFISLFASIYIVFFVVGLLMMRDGFKRADVIALIIYSSTIWYILAFITELIPEMLFLNVFIVYNIYVIFKGVSVYMKGFSKSRIILTTIALFIAVHFFPFIIKFSLFRLIIF